MRIELQDIRKSFGPTSVIHGVSLAIESDEIFFLLGPSGCGKTTLLRIIAGFISADSGDVLFDGRRVNDLAPEERRTPMVFQSYALWPHLSVFENTAYGLRVQKLGAAEVRRRAMDALDAVRMADHAARPPNQLSGGQQQRVAIARALATSPGVLLFDEPLSNLDAKLRVEMRQEILEIHRHRPFTAVYVTHDQEEAMTLAARIAVIDRGAVRQIGTPREIYAQPRDRFVAEFMGPMNWLPAKVRSAGADRFSLETSAGTIPLEGPRPPVDGEILAGFRPAAAKLDHHAGGDGLAIPCEIVQSQYNGPSQRLWLKTRDGGGLSLQAIEFNPRRVRAPGEAVTVAVAAADLVFLPP